MQRRTHDHRCGVTGAGGRERQHLTYGRVPYAVRPRCPSAVRLVCEGACSRGLVLGGVRAQVRGWEGVGHAIAPSAGAPTGARPSQPCHNITIGCALKVSLVPVNALGSLVGVQCTCTVRALGCLVAAADAGLRACSQAGL